jgi:hypothetical protein
MKMRVVLSQEPLSESKHSFKFQGIDVLNSFLILMPIILEAYVLTWTAQKN